MLTGVLEKNWLKCETLGVFNIAEQNYVPSVKTKMSKRQVLVGKKLKPHNASSFLLRLKVQVFLQP